MSQAADLDAEPYSLVLKPTVGSCTDGVLLLAGRTASSMWASYCRCTSEEGAAPAYLVQPYVPELAANEFKCHVIAGGHVVVSYAGRFPKKEGPAAPVTTVTSRVYVPQGRYYTDLCNNSGIVHVTEQDRLSQTSAWPAPDLYDAIVGVVRTAAAAVSGRLSQHEGAGAAMYLRVDVFVGHPLLFDHGEEGGRELNMRATPTVVVNEVDNEGSASMCLDLHDPFNDSCHTATQLPQSVGPLPAFESLYRAWRKELVSACCTRQVYNQAVW